MMDKKILVVDDEKPIADILEFNLRKEGYEVHCAHDGNEAVEMVEELQPDLILLDICFLIKTALKCAVKSERNTICRSLC